MTRKKIVLISLLGMMISILSSSASIRTVDKALFIEGKLISEDLITETITTDYIIIKDSLILPDASLNLDDFDVSSASDNLITIVRNGSVVLEPAPSANNFAANSITEMLIQDNSISTEKIKDDTVSNNKFAADSINGNKISNNAVSDSKIIQRSINNEKLNGASILNQTLIGFPQNSNSTIDSSSTILSSISSLDNRVNNNSIEISNKANSNNPVFTGNTTINGDLTITGDLNLGANLIATSVNGPIANSLLTNDIANSGNINSVLFQSANNITKSIPERAYDPNAVLSIDPNNSEPVWKIMKMSTTTTATNSTGQTCAGMCRLKRGLCLSVTCNANAIGGCNSFHDKCGADKFGTQGGVPGPIQCTCAIVVAE